MENPIKYPTICIDVICTEIGAFEALTLMSRHPLFTLEPLDRTCIANRAYWSSVYYDNCRASPIPLQGKHKQH